MSSAKRHPKSPLLLAIAVVMVTAVVAVQVVWAMQQTVELSTPLGVLAVVNAALWLLVLNWAIYHLTFRIGALMAGTPRGTAPAAAAAYFTVLYVTRDDFSEDSLRSCLTQKYPPESFCVVVCNDSDLDELAHAPLLKQLLSEHENARYLHRSTRRGFKAGNVNDAMKTLPPRDNEWVVIVDADGLLPEDNLACLNNMLGGLDPDIGFVQGSTSSAQAAATRFQQVMTSESDIFWQRDMVLRPRFGFLPFLGRGGAIRRTALEQVNGLPEVVSEDLAFALAARSAGWHGLLTGELRYFESFPRDFGAFLIRMKKTTAGAAELIRESLWGFLRGAATLVEKIDVLMWLCGYLVPPLVVVSLFLSTYVTAALTDQEVSVLHPWLAYLFIAMALLTIPSIASVTESLQHGVKYPFVAMTVHAAVQGVLAWQFLVHVSRRAEFWVTPKASSPPARPRLQEAAGTMLLGLAVGGWACWWWSPFSWIALSYASAWILFLLWYSLNDGGWLGGAARVAAAAPLILFVIGLVRMWQWSLV